MGHGCVHARMIRPGDFFRGLALLAITASVLSSAACGGDDDGDGSGGASGDLSARCASICDKTAPLGCPDDADCKARCEGQVAASAGCERQAEALLACTDARPVSDFACDEFGESGLVEGVCTAEGEAVFACVLGGGSAGSGGSSGGGGGSGGVGSGPPPIIGPAIDSAPADWMRAADCGGIGDACQGLFGCGERSQCQSVGDVCIPALEPGATSLPAKSAERPYCAAFTCMTFEEASCFCTGEGGMDIAGCESPSALAGLCQSRGGGCDEDPCCDGFSCVDDGSGRRICDQTCTTAEECETGCCTDLHDLGYQVCADQAACENPCKRRGEACTPGTSTTPNDCCRGACLESENPDWAGCRPRCDTDADCPETGCCMPFTGETSGFCTDAVYCSCGEVDAPCGHQGEPQCCEGNVCAGTSDETLTCNQVCTTDTDCATGCCSPLASGDTSICSTPDYCQ